MPTYEYACQSCGHRFDIWQEVGSSAPPCENCQEATKKVFQPPRVIFKGSGFYVTDMRSEKSAKSGGEKSESGGESKGDSAGESKSEAPKTESKTETKSDSKSESKSESKPASNSSSA